MFDSDSVVSLSNRVYRRRQIVNRVMLTLSGAAVAFGLFWLFWIIIPLLTKGASALSFSLLTQPTAPLGADGGLLDAVVGSVLMAAVASVIGWPVGVLAGTYLVEYVNRGLLAPATRFLNGVLLWAPSIVIGLFIYAVYVAQV